MLTTDISWGLAGAPYRATCCEGFETRCGELATYRRQWQTSAMVAPAFDYYCSVHAFDRCAADGLELPPSETFTVQKLDGTGRVHNARPLRADNGTWSRVVLTCSGRAMRGMVATSAAVTCKACERKGY